MKKIITAALAGALALNIGMATVDAASPAFGSAAPSIGGTVKRPSGQAQLRAACERFNVPVSLGFAIADTFHWDEDNLLGIKPGQLPPTPAGLTETEWAIKYLAELLSRHSTSEALLCFQFGERAAMIFYIDEGYTSNQWTREVMRAQLRYITLGVE